MSIGFAIVLSDANFDRAKCIVPGDIIEFSTVDECERSFVVAVDRLDDDVTTLEMFFDVGDTAGLTLRSFTYVRAKHDTQSLMTLVIVCRQEERTRA